MSTVLPKTSTAAPARIVLPITSGPTFIQPITITQPIQFPILSFQRFAPAWFYSALNWLGRSYYDASGVSQRFNTYMVGSDVDPYTQLGSTRLFIIDLSDRDAFYLTIAPDVNSMASSSLSTATTYPNTNDGILRMYLTLAASSIFSSVQYCYIPARLGPGLSPKGLEDILQPGYDPNTGLRIVVLGSAVSQVVPLEDYLVTYNEQIYTTNPTIVPFVTCLVYDVTTNNVENAKTFLLPTFYTPDMVSTGNYYVNKLGSNTELGGSTINYGQTVLFPGGPGYNDSAATPLTLQTTTTSSTQGNTSTTYSFDKGTVVTVSTSKLTPRAQIGVYSLTYTGSSPLTVFSKQQIIGFYRGSGWNTCLGVPIYDFGLQNSSFLTASQFVALPDPIVVYNPSDPFLNGGSLQNVLRKLSQATYLYPPDRLLTILNNAATSPRQPDTSVGLSVTTAALDFTLTSPPTAPILDQLTAPVLVSVTTTPAHIEIPILQTPIKGLDTKSNLEVPISSDGNDVINDIQLAPVTVQVGLTASIPEEALSGTGITSIEIGTAFPIQLMGSGGAFQLVGSEGIVFNLMARANNDHISSFPPYNLNITAANTGITFTTGIYYVLSLTGPNLTIRGSDESSMSSVLKTSPDPSHTFVGAMVYTKSMTSILLYPKLQLTLPSPSVGTNGVLQGEQYDVRLTFGDGNSVYDIFDSTQAVYATNITVPNPTPTDDSKPHLGDLYFGSFTGGSSHMTVWAVPVFLIVSPPQLPGASFNGTMVLAAEASGVPGYQLQITDSSLFVYNNINVDTGSIGSVSAKNVFLASAVVNSSPNDGTSKAFAPCKLLMGLIRQAQMGNVLKYVFVPEDDSVLIGSIRYMLSVINLRNLEEDPNSRPYPPVFWPQSRYWQFANRHNPYLDVAYTGENQQVRIQQAQADVARIALQTARAQEPMHMYLDTNPGQMTVWPIYAFPYTSSTQVVDQGQFQVISSTILNILKTSFPAPKPFVPGVLDSEKVTLPDELQLNNPYTAPSASSPDTNPSANGSVTTEAIEPVIVGLQVTNLTPNTVKQPTAQSLQAQQSLVAQQTQKANAALAVAKSLSAVVNVTQARGTLTGTLLEPVFKRIFQSIYGFSVYNPGTGEAYIVEVVDADFTPPDQLPNPTTNITYDPYYVRVVFLNTLTCYNMSIIVPSMAYDQYGVLAHQGTSYQNLLSQTDDLSVGYMYSLYDTTNNFNSISLNPYPPTPVSLFEILSQSQSYVYTNLPYSTEQPPIIFNPISLFGGLTALTPIVTNSLFTSAFIEPSMLFSPSLITYT